MLYMRALVIALLAQASGAAAQRLHWQYGGQIAGEARPSENDVRIQIVNVP
jgi:hypothetical protein